jgi:hypothetical protein
MRYTVWGHPVEITYTTTILSKVNKGTERRDQTGFNWQASDIHCGIIGILSTYCCCAVHLMLNKVSSLYQQATWSVAMKPILDFFV